MPAADATNSTAPCVSRRAAQRVPSQEIAGPAVDVEHLVPVLLGNIFRIGEVADASVAHQEIKAAKPCDSILDELPTCVSISHVTVHRDGVARAA